MWLVSFVLLRKLLRVVCAPSKKAKRRHSHRAAATVNTADSVNSSGSSNTVSTDRSSLAPYFSVRGDAAPGTNQVTVGDGVIVVNRNDRYIEVYERKRIEKVDHVDGQVEALFRDFSARSQP